MDDPTKVIAAALDQVGPRLKRLRTQRGVTLTSLAAATGISKSTLSRLETGQRRASLELLLPLAQAYHVPLDDLVGAPEVGDPRIRQGLWELNSALLTTVDRMLLELDAATITVDPDQRRMRQALGRLRAAVHDAARATHGCSWCRLREASTTANARSASASMASLDDDGCRSHRLRTSLPCSSIRSSPICLMDKVIR